jgi:DNA-3-methyladenine glycosylase I
MALDDGKPRCNWDFKNSLMLKYHDEEWGEPLHEDNKIFELIVLEGAQAGLSWETILRRRENYRRAFDDFDPVKVSGYSEERVEELLQDAGIIRNRRKIESAINNARAFLQVQREFGTFDKYIWNFVDGRTKINEFKSFSEMPKNTEFSTKLSKNLKKCGFSFVGPTICYALMQSIGMVNDHLVHCFRWREIKEKHGV